MSPSDDPPASGTVTEVGADAPPPDDAEEAPLNVPSTGGGVTVLDVLAAAPLDPAARYHDLEHLGAGGMGEVALRADDWIGREVACKTLRSARADSGAARVRFMREMRVQGQLEHPSIVPIYDFGVEPGGRMFFTMRRVRGPTLQQVLEGIARGDDAVVRRYSRRKLLTAFVSAALAVHYAHTRGVLHRDIKPSNIMLGPFGEVYVLDWGIAKLVGDTRSLVTAEGAIVGTPAYMAPEQLLGMPTLDARADVYALGMVLFDLLALRPLHRGRRAPEIIKATLDGLDTRPSVHAADLPPELDAICVRATARNAAHRFETAEELATAVERYLDGDRDLERRRSLASEHLGRARILAAKADGAEGAEAMREVVTALTLDPSHDEARRALVELLVKVPEQMPPSVQADMDRAMAATRRTGAGTAFLTYVTCLLMVPAGLLNGVRSWLVFGVCSGALCLATAYTGWMWRRGAVAARNFYTVAALQLTIVASLAAWLGPFVLIPTMTAEVTVVFAVLSAGRERLLLTLVAPLAVLIPFGLEAAHLVPPSVLFEEGRMVLLARGYDLNPRWTLGLLLYTTVLWIVLPPFYLARMRDALTGAQRQLLLHAWHFRNLLPDMQGGASREGYSSGDAERNRPGSTPSASSQR
jgi:eukaryotic-like serine/threonine-protein kinase